MFDACFNPVKPDQQFLTASDDGTFKIWGNNCEAPDTTFHFPFRNLKVIYAPDGQFAYGINADSGMVTIRPDKKGFYVSKRFPDALEDIKLRSDGKEAFVLDAKNNLHILQLFPENLPTEIETYAGISRPFAISADGNNVYFVPGETAAASQPVASMDATVQLLQTRYSPQKKQEHYARASILNGDKIVLALRDQEIQVINTQNMKLDAVFKDSVFFGNHLAGNGHKILYSTNKQVKVFDLDTKLPTHSISIDRYNDGMAEFAPSGDQIALSPSTGIVEIWDADLKVRYHRYVLSDSAEVIKLFFLKNGDLLVISGDYDHPVSLTSFDSAQKKVRYRRILQNDRHAEIALSNDGTLLAVSTIGSVFIWETSEGKNVGAIRLNSLGNAVCFSPDNKILCATIGRTVFFYDLRTHCLLDQIKTSYGVINYLNFKGESDTLMFLTTESDIGLIDLNQKAGTMKTPRMSSGFSSGILAISPDSRYLAYGDDEKKIILWDAKTQARLFELEGHLQGVTSLIFSSDSKRLFSGGNDQAVIIWDLEKRIEISALGNDEPITDIKISHHDKRLYAGQRYQVVFWNLDSLTNHVLWENYSDRNYVAVSPDEKTLMAAAGQEGKIKAWKLPENTPLFEFSDEDSFGTPITSLAISPDGNYFAFSNDNNSIGIWTMKDHKKWASLSGHSGQINCLAFSPDGKTLASADDGGVIILWDVAKKKERSTLSGHDFSTETMSFSPDGLVLYAGMITGDVYAWDVKTQKQTFILSDTFKAEEIEPVSAEDYVSDQQLQVLNRKTQQRKSFQGEHGYTINALALSANGKELASGDYQGVIKTWDLTTLEEKRVIETETEIIHDLKYGADDQWLLSSPFFLWDPQTGKRKVDGVFGNQGVSRIIPYPGNDKRFGLIYNNKFRVIDLQNDSLIAAGRNLFQLSALTPAVIELADLETTFELADISVESLLEEGNEAWQFSMADYFLLRGIKHTNMDLRRPYLEKSIRLYESLEKSALQYLPETYRNRKETALSRIKSRN